nr:hypothetical protein CFP56_10170 [Quercus suber]
MSTSKESSDEYNSVVARWDSASSFQEICLLNQSFLKGEVSCTPYQHGPVLEETGEALEDLFRIHDYSILTCCSNIYGHTVEFEDAKNEWTEHQQRPSIDFITPGDSSFPYVKLLKDLGANPHVRVKVWRDRTLEDLAGSNLEVSHIMRHRYAKRKEDLSSTPWRIIGSTGVSGDDELRGFQPYDLEVVSETDPLQWQVLMTEWDETKAIYGGNLIAVVLEAVKRCFGRPG